MHFEWQHEDLNTGKCSFRVHVFNFLKNIFMAVPGLSYSMQDLRSSLWHLGSSFVTRD